VDVKSTVGAGDAMVAGIISAQLQRATLAECARTATAFAADAITHIGSGLSSPTAFADLLSLVELEVG
jgi:1-phosphofructokinase